MSRPLGVLRPEPGNAATAARIAGLGHRTLRLPLFAVTPVAWEAPDPGDFDALLLTSANAVRHGGDQLAGLRALPVIAVGAATARAARDAGLTVTQIGEAGVAALRLPPRVLHLAGREHHAVPEADTRIVYDSVALSPDLSGLSDGVALVHSPRAGARLAKLVAERRGIAVAAISPAAAAAAGSGWRAIAVADRPDDVATIAAALTLAD
ncbi:uroporphyrinogen-III synthase [Sphingomonas guangdongensis]|uniref:Uroporphyrinogen-III synthase n=1 Tax=Sphingomonas guangdongensis TaxID=1141890 RepID=A0A285QJY4_9SPHN|nr:uroporphyrinogen-III synthase [Sphingomonas guangdongensis]SOB80382.1 uroporphyrinogen-III synthase [Sphingomonas guangdongensis]